jgi:hypothetical protein
MISKKAPAPFLKSANLFGQLNNATVRRSSRSRTDRRHTNMRIGILLVVVFALASSPSPGRADDYGPHRALREIRGSLPILLATRVKRLPTSTLRPEPPIAVSDIRVNDVVVDGDGAVAEWTAGREHGLVTLAYHHSRWWMTGEANYSAPDAADRNSTPAWYYDSAGASGCYVHTYGLSIAPTTDDLHSKLGVAIPLAAIASQHISVIAQAGANVAAYRASHVNEGELVPGGCLSYPDEMYPTSETDGYQTIWWKGPGMINPHFSGLAFHTRAPTVGEMPPSFGANSYFFFSMEFARTTPIEIAGGSELDVWCPFVLDSDLRYSVTIAGGDPVVGPIDGTLRDNELHFNLPAFAAKPGVELMGEIEGNPPYPR